MEDKLRVHALTLTDSDVASEHVYAGELGTALANRGIEFVDDWRRADIVHLFEVNFFTREAIDAFQYPTLLRIVHSDTPLVISTDDLYFIDRPELTAQPELYRLNHYVQRWLLTRADAVIAISESVKRALTRHLAEEKVHVVYHGVAERYFLDSKASRTPFVLHVSQASPRKNPDTIVEVACRLDARFVIAGEGWMEHLADTSGTGNVELPGYISESELIELYRDAAIFYFPTLHEGFGLPVLEAMAAGCAVVTSNVYSVPEVTGDAAITLDPTAVDSHVDAIHSLLKDDTRRETLGQAAQDRAQEFSWETAAENTEYVYRTTLPNEEVS